MTVAGASLPPRASSASIASIAPGRRAAGPVSRWEAASLGLVVVAASLVRFVGLAARGTWDADQGHDLLVLRAFVRDGVVPLLGPPTSIGTFHHGALYYDLLAPAAWLGGLDPTWVAAEIALAGVAAVAVLWWAVRAMGGPLAGLAAAGLLAVSATAIRSSTFIWNPNLVALSASVVLGAAWRAWDRRRPAWWLLAAAGVAVTAQLHILGAVLALPTAGFWLADVRRSPGSRRSVAAWGMAGLGLVAASYLPLLIHEVGHDFAETRAIVDYVRSGGAPSALGPLVRIVDGTLRILAWPLTGLFTDAPVPAALVTAGLLVGGAWRLVSHDARERAAMTWLAATLVVSTLVLSITVGSITVVTPLPTDQYHSFLDPFIVAVAGIAIAALLQGPLPGRVMGGIVLASLVTWNVATWPPAVAPDGGWPAAVTAASRIVRTTGAARIEVVSLPAFKPPDAYVFPLVRAGHAVAAPDPNVPSTATVDETGVGAVVVVCDALFVPDCGGAAERAWWAAHQALAARLAVSVADPVPADRFTSAPGRTISVYR